MKLYTHSLEIGRIKRGAKSEIVRETPVSAVIDAHDAIGQPVSVAAMQMAIDKAKRPASALLSSATPTTTASPVIMPRWLPIRACWASP